MCNNAKSTPPATVTKVQRSAPDLLPNFVSLTAISIVRLLVTKMKVMIITLMMLGENLKGVGKFGVASRRYPYPYRTAPNVTASESMNNHMTSFLEAIAKGDGSMKLSCTSLI